MNFFILQILLLSSCTWAWGVVREGSDPFFLIVLVDARHFNYSDSQRFLQTFTKHPANGSKQGEVGHAWIYLQGRDSFIEGGHTGEYGTDRPRYVDGIMRYLALGDSNPVKYLWESLNDGVFQKGSGGHSPTYAAKFKINCTQYLAMRAFIDPESYPYRHYSLTEQQCTTFVGQVAALAGICLETDVTMKIMPTAKIAGAQVRLWSDPRYSAITFASPDVLEKSLRNAVMRGEAECALAWYKKRARLCKKRVSLSEAFCQFPYRYWRHLSTF